MASTFSNSANPKAFGSPFASVDLFQLTIGPQHFKSLSIKSSEIPLGILPI
jgi:hypothetical protein